MDLPEPRREAARRPTWPHFGNALLALWLLSNPFTFGEGARSLALSDWTSGGVLLVGSFFALHRSWGAWLCATVGLWLMAAPLLFATESAAIYQSDTLIGGLVVCFAVVLPRLELDYPSVRPHGWTYNPSAWHQRTPIVVLALIGFLLSRYMAAYQLGHLDTVWDPFFGEGTKRVLTSGISEAFRVSDAGLGALSYLVDAIAGLIGGRSRWRTMPWMVLLFGFFIIPPGVTSIVLVILQPLGVGAWCTVCLITAVVMLMMVPPAVDEVFASIQYLRRVHREGGRTWHVFWHGDHHFEGEARPSAGPPRIRQLVHAVEIFSMPWTLMVTTAIGAWLMAAPGVLGMEGLAKTGAIVAGACVVTASIIAGAEPVRLFRWLNAVAALWLLIAPWFLASGQTLWIVSQVASGVLLLVLTWPRGSVDDRYGTWDRWIK